MSFADWLAHTRTRFREDPAPQAVRDSTAAFIDGARAELEWWLIRYLEPDHAAHTTFGDVDVKFVVKSRSEIKRAKHAIREQPLLEWFIDPIGRGWTVWDIGAFHGTYAITCALKGADVLAFEPNPPTRRRLFANRRINRVPDIWVLPDALSDVTGRARFGGDELHPRKGITDTGEATVHATRGDDLLGFIPQPDAIKIDVEGHECAVLDGMEETLSDVRRALVEVHDGVSVATVRDHLEAAGLSTRVERVGRPQPYVCGVRE